jgi:hypothetical protein
MSDVATHLDGLRVALGETEALAAVTAEAFDRQEWDDADPLHVERMASLLGLISRSATGALAAFHRLHSAVADAAPAPAGERWNYSEGTAQGEGEALSAEDAAIVRRIRERCTDGRYDGGSDAELIQLFRRNRQVLGRSDEDVIAAMTHAR